MKYVLCNICGSDNWYVRFASTLTSGASLEVAAFRCTSAGYGEHTQIVDCHECGHVYANPTWEPDELLSAYSTVEDETYVDEREGRELTFRKHLDAVEALIGSGNGRKLLDVGAYIGVFVEIAQQKGWDAIGIEPSAWAVAEAEARDLKVFPGTLDNPIISENQYSLITLWDVIEHVEDPRAQLLKTYALLEEGGLIVVHTMDVKSLIARLMRHRWPWYMAMHVHYFSKRSLARLVEECGFEVVQIKTEGRYLRLGYLGSRLIGFNRPIGRMINWLIQKAGAAEIAIPINFGDLFTVYATKPRQRTDVH